jgi:hypothetical protein
MGMLSSPRPGSPEPAESRRKGASPTFSPLVHVKGSSSPSRLEITRRGRSWLGKPVGGLASAQWCFGRCSSAIAPVCRGTMSQCRGVARRGDEGGSITPLSTSPLLEDPGLGGGGLHPLPSHHPPGGTLISLSLHAHISVQGHVSPTTSRHSLARWPLMAHHGHPIDPTQNHERCERIESQKPPKRGLAY